MLGQLGQALERRAGGPVVTRGTEVPDAAAVPVLGVAGGGGHAPHQADDALSVTVAGGGVALGGLGQVGAGLVPPALEDGQRAPQRQRLGLWARAAAAAGVPDRGLDEPRGAVRLHHRPEHPAPRRRPGPEVVADVGRLGEAAAQRGPPGVDPAGPEPEPPEAGSQLERQLPVAGHGPGDGGVDLVDLGVQLGERDRRGGAGAPFRPVDEVEEADGVPAPDDTSAVPRSEAGAAGEDAEARARIFGPLRVTAAPAASTTSRDPRIRTCMSRACG